MADIIYTGKNYAQYTPSQGRALQALSQFSQQHAIRQERELQRARQDRDLLAKTMQLDPVYATSAKLQERIGKEMDSYINDMTLLYKESQGRPLTSEDLMKVQQRKAQSMAKMGQLKAWDDELQKASQLVRTRPDIYDARKFADAYQEFQETGIMPQEGLLYPAVKNPFDEFFTYVNKRRGTPREESREWIEYKNGGGEYRSTYKWPMEEQMPEQALINTFGGSQMGQYYIQNTFDDPRQVPTQQRQEYLKRTGGDERSAANLWFQEGVQGKVYPKTTKTVERAPTVSEQREDRSGIHKRGGTTYSGNYALFSTQQNIPVVDGTLQNAVLFSTPQAQRNPSSLPKDKLLLPEGVEAKSATVKAIPYAADKNKTYWIIDRKALENISFTESAAKAYGLGQFDKITSGDNKGKWKIKEDVDVDIMIPTNTGDVLGLLDGWTGGSASEEIAALPTVEQEKIEW